MSDSQESKPDASESTDDGNSPVGPEGHRPKRLGELLVEEGVLTDGDVEKLLELQSKQPREDRQPIGKLAVELGFLSERRLRDLLDLHGKRLSLGELLVARGLIEPTELEVALAIQAEQGGLLGEVLAERGLIDEVTLTRVLSEQSDIPYVPLRVDDSWKKGLTRLVQQSYAIRHGIVPVSQIGRVLTLAVWHPAAIGLQQEMEISTGMQIRFVMDMRGQIYDRIQEIYDITADEIRDAQRNVRQATTLSQPQSEEAERRFGDLGLDGEECQRLTELYESGEGIFVVCGVGQDKVEDVYLRLLRYGKASGGLDSARKMGSLTGVGEVKDTWAAESVFRDVRDKELRLAIVSGPNTTQAFGRLVTLGVHADRLTEEFIGGLAVCSIRTNCQECSAEYQPHKLVLAEWFGSRPAPAKVAWSRGLGCDVCGGTGYSGEQMVAELWTPTPKDHDWLRGEAAHGMSRQFRDTLLQRLTGIGFKSLQMAIRGETTLEEVLKVLPPQEVRSVRQAA